MRGSKRVGEKGKRVGLLIRENAKVKANKAESQDIFVRKRSWTTLRIIAEKIRDTKGGVPHGMV